MNKYLFLFTIGPVQSFIVQARKTHDLYAGSKLLSDLIAYALSILPQDKNQCEIIFPHFNKKEMKQNELDCQDLQKADNRSYPNRLIAKLSFEQRQSEEQINQFEKDFEDKVKNKLVEIAKRYIPDYETISGVKEQIEDFLQVYWVIVPLEKEGKERPYPEVYKETERYLGAVKNVRTFKQLNYQTSNDGKPIFGEVGRKCSLNGEYNVKFYRLSESDIKSAKRRIQKEKAMKSDEPSFEEIKSDIIKSKLFLYSDEEAKVFKFGSENEKNLSIENKIEEYILQPGEGLSAISLLKRKYAREKENAFNFESTADVALYDALNYLWNNHNGLVKNYISEFHNQVNDNDQSFLQKKAYPFSELDGQLYYEENLNENYFKKQGYPDLKTKLTDIKAKWKNLKDEAEKAGYYFEKSKYYAILTFDGDSMGKWLSGDNLDPNSDLLEFHQRLSKTLSDFAKWATNYINDEDNNNIPKGRTVYAGGDDFLAFINLNHLFDVMQKLREEYRTKVSDKLKKYKKDQNEELTFSAGVAIAHYKVPLSIALKEARKMQEEAKGIDDKKDAFGITVLKHSGETPSAIMKWTIDSNLRTVNIADGLKYLLVRKEKEKGKSLSDKFIYTFHREFSKLMERDGKIEIEEGILKMELSRLALRAFSGMESSEKKKIKEKFIEGKLFPLYSNACGKTEKDLLNFINCLHIINFVSKNINQYKLQEPEILRNLETT